MNLGIKDRLALVTGCSRGIGRGIVEALSREGARVILVARSAEALEAVRQQLPDPDKHTAVAVDLMSDGGIQALADVIGKLGNLDIMVHNLGGSAGVFNTFASADDWRRVWQFNVGIGIELNRRFVPAMVQRRWGRIVHLSTLGTVTFKGNAAYTSAKCALNGYVKSVCREVAKDNVILSAVAPGAVYIEGRHFAKLQKENPAALDEYFKHNQPIRRLASVDEIGPVVAFLCSEQASFMAGSIVGIDGGGM